VNERRDDVLDRTAGRLLEKETLDEYELKALVEYAPDNPADHAAARR